MAWFDGIDVKVEISFSTDPLETPSWTDVSAYVRDISTSRGRSDEFSSIGPGSATVTFHNNAREFDPEHGGEGTPFLDDTGATLTDDTGATLTDGTDPGPFYGYLLPMKMLRISVVYSTVTYPLFTGYVQGWPQTYGRGNVNSTVTVEAIDGLRILDNFKLGDTAYTSELITDGVTNYWPLQESIETKLWGAAEDTGLPVDVFGEGVEWRVPLADWDAEEAASAPTYGKVGGVPVSGAPLGIFPHSADSWSFYDNAYLTASGGPIKSYQTMELWLWIHSANLGGTGEPYKFQMTVAGADASSYFEFHWTDDTNNLVANIKAAGYETASSQTLTNTGWFEYNRWHHLVFTMDSSSLDVYCDGALIHTVSTSVDATVNIGDAVSILCFHEYTYARAGLSHLSLQGKKLTEARVKTHLEAAATRYAGDLGGTRIGRILDLAGWPTGWRSIDDGQTQLGPFVPGGRSALECCRDVESAEQGVMFMDTSGYVAFKDRSELIGDSSVFTFTDDEIASVEVDANTIEAIRNVVTVTSADGTKTVRDDDSITSYGPGEVSVSAPNISSTQAGGLASYVIREGKDPRTRITRLDVQPRSNPSTLVPAAAGLELGDTITVAFYPLLVGPQLSKSLIVQGIDHRISSDGHWDVSLSLTPKPGTGLDYLTIGDATKGVIGATAANAVPY